MKYKIFALAQFREKHRAEGWDTHTSMTYEVEEAGYGSFDSVEEAVADIEANRFREYDRYKHEMLTVLPIITI